MRSGEGGGIDELCDIDEYGYETWIMKDAGYGQENLHGSLCFWHL